MADEIADISAHLKEVPMSDLSLLYWIYLTNLDRCPHSPDGHKRRPQSPEVCMRNKCRVFKQADGFCAYASAMSLRVGIFMTRAAAGLAALRAARTLRKVNDACTSDAGADAEAIKSLQAFSNCRARGKSLARKVSRDYLAHLSISVDEIIALLPMALGGKRCLAEEYVAKRHGGDSWRALEHYGRETYSWMEAFFRDNGSLFEDISGGNGVVSTLRERLEHADKFTDPFIRHVLEPFLVSIETRRPPEHDEAEAARRKAIGSVVSLMTRAAAMTRRTVGAT